MEPTTGLEPVNLFLTKEVLYLLSYVGSNWGVMGAWARSVREQPARNRACMLNTSAGVNHGEECST